MIWSFVLAAVGIIGLLIAGRKNKWGWAINFGAQALWIVYAIVTTQYGFVISALAYSIVYGMNFFKWREEERKEREKCIASIAAIHENERARFDKEMSRRYE